MHLVVVNNHTMHLHEIKKIFPAEAHITYISYTQVGGYDFSQIDGVVLTGSSNHPYYSTRFHDEMVLLQNISCPLIGICLGCELIAEAYGATIQKKQERIHGDILIYEEGSARPYSVYEAHRYVILALSDQLHGLAKSDAGYEIIQHTEKPIIGFQFHPESMMHGQDGYRLFQKYAMPLLIKPKIYIHHNDGYDDGTHYAFMSHRMNP